jgi:hypothetical protein
MTARQDVVLCDLLLQSPGEAVTPGGLIGAPGERSFGLVQLLLGCGRAGQHDRRRESEPVVHVAFEGAAACAVWAGKDLATEAESSRRAAGWTVLRFAGVTSSPRTGAGWPTPGRANSPGRTRRWTGFPGVRRPARVSARQLLPGIRKPSTRQPAGPVLPRVRTEGRFTRAVFCHVRNIVLSSKINNKLRVPAAPVCRGGAGLAA